MVHIVYRPGVAQTGSEQRAEVSLFVVNKNNHQWIRGQSQQGRPREGVVRSLFRYLRVTISLMASLSLSDVRLKEERDEF